MGMTAVGVGVMLWRFGPEWSVVGRTLAGMSWEWALVAVGLNLASALTRGLAWRRCIVEAIPPPHARLLDVFSAFFLGIFANGILPGRIGELARVAVLRRRLRQREIWPALLGSVAAHRLLEIFPWIGLLAWVLLAARLPHWGLVGLLVVVGAGTALFAAGVLVARRHEHVYRHGGGTRAALGSARQGLGILRSPAAAAYAGGLQISAWALQLGAVWTAMRAFHLAEPAIAAGVVLALMNVALIIPLWPGNVGLQQAAVALPLLPYGVPYAHGFAFGIGLQAIESSVGYLLGLAFLLREGLSLRGLGRVAGEVPAVEEG
jgi:hypothetical protein